MDLGHLPHTMKGPLKTPPIENYDRPDGEYINITQKFEGEEWGMFDALQENGFNITPENTYK